LRLSGPSIGRAIAGRWLHWRLNFEGSIRASLPEHVLLDARCRVTNAQNLQQGDDEEPSAGGTAAVALTQRIFSKAMMKNQMPVTRRRFLSSLPMADR
jgi:hypothetical protein